MMSPNDSQKIVVFRPFFDRSDSYENYSSLHS